MKRLVPALVALALFFGVRPFTIGTSTLAQRTELTGLSSIYAIAAGAVLTPAGQEIPLKVDTLCVHGDTPGAAELVKRIRAALEAAGVQVRPL